MSEGRQYGHSFTSFSRFLRLHMVLLIFLLNMVGWIIAQPVNMQIKGQIQLGTSDRDYQQIASACFMGLGLASCTFSTFDMVQPSYYAEQVIEKAGTAQYCLGCCSTGTERKVTELWGLSCPVSPQEANTKNLYGYEFRLLRNRFIGDIEVSWCPLWRESCLYDEAGNLLQT